MEQAFRPATATFLSAPAAGWKAGIAGRRPAGGPLHITQGLENEGQPTAQAARGFHQHHLLAAYHA